MQDNKITKWQGAAPVVTGIYAYGLNMEQPEGGETIIITFNSNADAENAYITFTDADGNVVATIDVPDVVAGENSVTINTSEIACSPGDELSWSVTVEGKPITTIGRINPREEIYSGNLFVAVDKSPCSKHMGTIYAGNRVSSNNANNGVYVCDVMGQRVSDDLYRGGHSWGSPYRMAVDCQGKLYVPDWGDAVSGVYIADPDDMAGTWTEFFVGTRASSGLITNEGQNVGSSTPGVGIGGKGADTKLYVYLEDFGNGIGVYSHFSGFIVYMNHKIPGGKN